MFVIGLVHVLLSMRQPDSQNEDSSATFLLVPQILFLIRCAVVAQEFFCLANQLRRARRIRGTAVTFNPAVVALEDNTGGGRVRCC